MSKDKAMWYTDILGDWGDDTPIDRPVGYLDDEYEATIFADIIVEMYEHVVKLPDAEQRQGHHNAICTETYTSSEDYDEENELHIDPEDSVFESWSLAWDEESSVLRWKYFERSDAAASLFEAAGSYDGKIFVSFGKNYKLENEKLVEVE